ncbi:hypothetical protein N7931_10880 [Catenovulum sp. 2E275]|uniref:hypothetical protein n=1 Tax=Catenovulum sp. 2E275 TaxID=2980497 RepID=UPI0021D22A44|nr:hypothetical protein [Catenovulum sp. 2E275]MCU4676133.1 hypothetical protein [Catenovulum sp. 2E275]
MSHLFTQLKQLKLTTTLLINSAFILVCSQLSGCNQASAYQLNDNNQTAQQAIPKTVVQNVQRTFQAKFVYGDWRFSETRVIKNSINAFIQIPDKLNMSKEQQQNYISQMICPAKHNSDFWQQVAPHELWVHLYTHDKRYSVYSKCDNPYA